MKKLTRPTLKSATVLSAREMNALRFSGKHTILTPGRLRKLAEAADADDSAAVGAKSAVAAEAGGKILRPTDIRTLDDSAEVHEQDSAVGGK